MGTRAQTNEKEMRFAIETVETNYLSTYEIPLVRGRNFSSTLPTDSTSSILVNEFFYK
jgi:putative ABC transport system permease protein